MLYTLKNDKLCVTITTEGAKITSVRDGKCEYIWQADERYWPCNTPLMFPICGRFFEAKYTHDGKVYDMGTHGFIRNIEFCVDKASESEIVFSLTENEETLKQYPFSFKLTVSYKLEDRKIISSATIQNTGSVILPAAFGAHPGFNVPLDCGSFEDWYIEFSEECTPNEVLQSPNGLATGKKRAYELEDGKIIRLRHSLFDVDSIFLDRTAKSATLKSDKSKRFVTLNFPDMTYLGIWHKPRTDAPYVCIEPWCGIFSYEGEMTDIMEKNDMFHILPSKSKKVGYEIIFG